MNDFPYPDHPAAPNASIDGGSVYEYELRGLPPEMATRIRLGDPLIGIVYSIQRPAWTLCELVEATDTTLTLRFLGSLKPNYKHRQGVEAEFPVWLIDEGPGQIWLDP